MLGIRCPHRHALPRITSSKMRRPRRVLPSRASGFVLRRNLVVRARPGEGRVSTPFRPFAALVAKDSFGSQRTEVSADASGQPLQPQKARAVRVGTSVMRFKIDRNRDRLS